MFKPPQLARAEGVFFKEELAQEGKLEGLRWVDRKLAAKELDEIKRRLEELEKERKLVEESLANISKTNLPKASNEFYVVRRNIDRSVQNARKLWLALAGAEAFGVVAAAIASGGGILLAGAAGAIGIVGGMLGSRSLSSSVEREVERIGEGMQLMEVRERLKDELNLFEREGRKLHVRRADLLKLFGEGKGIPIRRHIERFRNVMENLKLMNEIQLGFLKNVRRRRVIPQLRLREIHDSAQELAYLSSLQGGDVNTSLLVKNIAREMSADLALRMDDVVDLSEISQAGLSYMGKATGIFERRLSGLRYVSPLYFE